MADDPFNPYGGSDPTLPTPGDPNIPGSAGTQVADEFIELRERQLPADTRAPQGDTVAQGAGQAALDQAPLGSMPPAFDVRSIFDSRPVSARDFNMTSSTNTGEDGSSVDVTIVVPAGYVMVLRRVHHFMDPAPTFDSRNDVLATLLINGAAYPNNTNIPVGVESDDLMYFFAIADENVVVGIRFTFGTPLDATDVYAHFYGNLLAKTGVPIQFEIANPMSNLSRAPQIQTPPQPAPPPPPAALPSPPPPPQQPAMEIPPFEIEWSYVIDQRPRVYFPVTTQGGKKRRLTTAEQVRYKAYLDAAYPRG